MNLKLLLILLSVTAIGCLPPPNIDSFAEPAISVAEERISLSPLICEAELNKLPDWPKQPIEQQLLANNLSDAWNKLLIEFRRCQKYGLYTMVEDNDNPTFRISVILTDLLLENDTLTLPVRLQAERLRDDQRFVYTFPAKAYAHSRTRASSPFHYYGELLANYRRNFPQKDIVSYFYRHKISKD